MSKTYEQLEPVIMALDDRIGAKAEQINALGTRVTGVEDSIGDLSQLTTTAKDNLVVAINEVNETITETNERLDGYTEITKNIAEFDPGYTKSGITYTSFLAKKISGNGNTSPGFVCRFYADVESEKTYIVSFDTDMRVVPAIYVYSDKLFGNLLANGVGDKGVTFTATANGAVVIGVYVGATINTFDIYNVQCQEGANKTYYLPHTTAIDAIARSGFGVFVTPEMYGAKGDGTTDDTKALQSAINSGLTVIMPNDYYVTSDLAIVRKHTKIYTFGTIYFDSDIAVFDIKSNANILCINRIVGLRSTNEDSTYSYYGIAFRLYADSSLVYYNDIFVNSCEAVKRGIQCVANNGYGVSYNRFKFNNISAEAGIYISCGNTGKSWVNENTFMGGHIHGNYGVMAIKGLEQTDPFNSNKFVNIGFEGLYCGIKAKFFQFNSFQHIRMSESLRGTNWIEFDSDCCENVVQGDVGLNYTQIQDLNNSERPNVYDFQQIACTWEGHNTFYVGYGGKTFKSVHGWSSEYTMPSQRVIKINGNGESQDVPPVGLITGWNIEIERADGAAIVNIPSNSGYGYGGAEILYFKIATGNYPFIMQYNGANIAKSEVAASESGYYELRCICNNEWIMTKLSEL